MSSLGYSLGCPFWSFEAWNGSLYSRDARAQDRLRQYARVFNAVEGNNTFYGTPGPGTVERWRSDVPPDFRFCFKLPRTVTHERMLRHADAQLDAFFEAMDPIADRLGPLLVQLPPAFGPEHLSDLEAFLDSLPGRFHYAVELRHADFFHDAPTARRVDALLEDRDCDRVIMDTRALRAGDPRHPEVVAALHKKPDLPVRPEPVGRRPVVRFVGHPDAATNDPWLDEWAERLGQWLARGLAPSFFVHTASNRQTPVVARDLHRRVGRHAAVRELPPFPGEAGERADGQLALL